MKTNLLKYYIAAFYIFSTFVMVAQPGAGNGETGDGALEGADAPAAPVDGYVWVLALIGLLFVFLKFRAVFKQGADLQA
jgi:hypothetical protein